jgi:type IV pilus assembly protein PilA
MRKLALAILFLILSISGMWAKNPAQETPQTARQALMEMFFSKESGTFLKHLPAITRATLEKSGAMTSLQQYSLLAGQFHAQGKSFQTFETGPVMLATEDPKTGQRTEIVVENDSLQGDHDDIQVSIHTYKDNQAQRTPFMPVIVFSMKMESGLWALNEVAVTIKLPLADPDLLKAISDGMKAHAAASSPQIHVQSTGQVSGQTPIRNFGGDANALAAVRKILAAETTYATNYPAVGFTCRLSDLDGFGAAEANEHQAMLISSGLAGGKHDGYAFSLSGCASPPATTFHLSATPTGESYSRRAFCADQTGAIRSSSDGNAATCQSSGTLVP